MDSITISITDNGDVRFLVAEETKPFLDGSAVVRRASHVEPKAYLLRITFHALRAMFGEHGRIADFTRAWLCLWRVNLAPIGGPVLPGLWRDRQAAISAEIVHLNATFI